MMPSSDLSHDLLPTRAELEALFLQKYGPPDSTGWSPRRRWKFGYFLPADVYEALILKLATPGCCWIDVGGGRDIFPENPRLARELAEKAGVLVGVDPSPNILVNEFVHERAQCPIEDYQADRLFDLATLRMVVEHVEEPPLVAQAIGRLLKPGGLAVVFTVNRRSPISLVSWWTPNAFHYRIKKLFWTGEEEDTFPVQYKMNTRSELDDVFRAAGLSEVAFAYLDHLALFGEFRLLNLMEMLAWRTFRRLGLRYPENCLLGIYRKSES